MPEILQDIAEKVQEAAKELKEDLKDDEIRAVLEAGMPTPMAEAFEETIEAVAADKEKASSPADDWEVQANTMPQDAIRVFNFPMKPFISIDVKRFEKSLPKSHQT